MFERQREAPPRIRGHPLTYNMPKEKHQAENGQTNVPWESRNTRGKAVIPEELR